MGEELLGAPGRVGVDGVTVRGAGGVAPAGAVEGYCVFGTELTRPAPLVCRWVAGVDPVGTRELLRAGVVLGGVAVA